MLILVVVIELKNLEALFIDLLATACHRFNPFCSSTFSLKGLNWYIFVLLDSRFL